MKRYSLSFKIREPIEFKPHRPSSTWRWAGQGTRRLFSVNVRRSDPRREQSSSENDFCNPFIPSHDFPPLGFWLHNSVYKNTEMWLSVTHVHACTKAQAVCSVDIHTLATARPLKRPSIFQHLWIYMMIYSNNSGFCLFKLCCNHVTRI